jgi:hypothetical protein
VKAELIPGLRASSVLCENAQLGQRRIRPDQEEPRPLFGDNDPSLPSFGNLVKKLG